MGFRQTNGHRSSIGKLALVNPNKSLGTLPFLTVLSFTAVDNVYFCLGGGPGHCLPGVSQGRQWEDDEVVNH